MSWECQHVISFSLEQVIHIGHGYIVEYNVLYRGHE